MRQTLFKYDVPAAAQRLRISEFQVRELCRDRVLRGKKTAGQWIIFLPFDEHMITVKGLAESMSYSEQHVRRIIRDHEIKHYRITRKILLVPLSEASKLMLMRLGTDRKSIG